MTTKLDAIRLVIGNGGFAAPLGSAHKRALLQGDGGPAAFAVFTAIADRTDWRPAIEDRANPAFLTCRGFNVLSIENETGLSRRTVQRALGALKEAGWLNRRGDTNPVWALNAERLREACADAPKVRPYVTPADHGDVEVVLTHLRRTAPAGKGINTVRERQTAAYLLQTHSVAEICAALEAAEQPVWSLAYVASGFKIAAKQAAPTPKPADDWGDDDLF